MRRPYLQWRLPDCTERMEGLRGRRATGGGGEETGFVLEAEVPASRVEGLDSSCEHNKRVMFKQICW
jgi:hypothetical protein